MARFKTILVIVVSTLFVLMVASTQSAQAQTFTVIHDFTGGQDGARPFAGLTMDQSGNLYGTTDNGGVRFGGCCGTVFKLTNRVSGWVFTPLYSFQGSPDGAGPMARVVFGPDGRLSGTTYGGGSFTDLYACRYGCGTVFRLQPPATAPRSALAPWGETQLHDFGSDDTQYPTGDLTFDQEGNLYGTTSFKHYSGGRGQGGSVYQMRGTSEAILYNFADDPQNGYEPWGGVIFDRNGNLYGTTIFGGAGVGTIFQLTSSGSGWTKNVLYRFQGGSDGGCPFGGLISDEAGNLFGSTSGYNSQVATIFELTPSGGGWTFSVLYTFAGDGPKASLVMDAAGNLYGTTCGDCELSNDKGTVFKLTHSGNSWIYTLLHQFTGGTDGAEPFSNVTLGANGKLYGTATGGGAHGYGVVWEITP